MKPAKIIIAIGVFLLVCILTMNAYIFGLYPGLDRLIDRTEVISILRVLPPLPVTYDTVYDPTNGTSSNPYRTIRVESLKDIKGRTPQSDDFEVSLWYLPVREHTDDTFKDVQTLGNLQPGECYLTFLRHRDSAWESKNCEGAAMPVSPLVVNTGRFHTLTTQSPKEAITWILNKSLELERKKLNELEAQTKLILR